MHVLWLWLRQCFTTFFLVFGGLGPLESLKFTLHLIAKFLGHSLLAFLILLSSSNDRTICFMRWFQISSFNLVSTFCTKIYKYTWQVWCLQFHPLSFQPRISRNAKEYIEAFKANRKISLNNIRGTCTDVYNVTVSVVILMSKLR